MPRQSSNHPTARSITTGSLAVLLVLCGTAQAQVVQSTQGAGASVAQVPVLSLRGPGPARTWAVRTPDAATSPMSFLADGQVVGTPDGYTATSEIHVLGLNADQLRAMPGVLSVAPHPHAPGLLVVRAGSVRAAATLADFLANDQRAEVVEQFIDGPRLVRSLPNDPGLSNQWHLRNTQIPLFDANVEPAWNMGFTGSGVTIGIIEAGWQNNHPDLFLQFNAAASLGPSSPTSHATSVAGVAAARGDNGLGGAGAAYNAQLADVSWFSTSAALGHEINVIDIYNSSWGYGDDIAMYNIPTADRFAMQDGWENGRNGKGNIYVWAAGNGGSNDRTDYDGWANCRYTFAIGAIGDQDTRANYNELGSSMLAVAHSSGNSRGVYTTTTGSGYTSNFGGTSSASPLAAGIFALVLEANPDLTARDLKHLVVNTARKNHPSSSGWTTNAAGHDFNDNYGFGALDAEALVNAALTWENVGPEVEIPSSFNFPNLTIPDNTAAWSTYGIDITDNIMVEGVELIVRVTVEDEDNIELELVSPSGTVSPLMRSTTTSGRNSNANNIDQRFMTYRAWDETSAGTWTVRIADRVSGPSGAGGATFDSVRLRIYGRAMPSNCAADFNNDGTVNVLDVVAFINTWNAQGPGSDANNDGLINILDVIAFINTWNLGCA